ncbi:MAG: hypothetical protein BWX55_00918 [Deltaproteobacteria bacterium ADurb.Bin022]|nr:MAG: hypothetical protein BWX55_00918 [Deltaproteobacteria bacterium ADurb.Bin022]
MIGIKNFFGFFERVFVLRFLGPGHVEYPVDVISHNRGFRGHGRHHLQLLDFLFDLFDRFFGHFLLFQTFFQFVNLVAEIVFFAHFLLDGAHLLVEVVILLRLLHLFFDAALDLFLDLQNFNFRKHQGINRFQSLADIKYLNDFLFVFEFDIEMSDDHIGKL